MLMNKQPYKIAILAMGGEGGGVLADWIVQLGEDQGYVAQTTSVPGVAQRTGATIYYVELFDPRTPQEKAVGQVHLTEKLPVLSLMPMPGDVDIVLASELMEAGRAVVRGLVTPRRTTLIASTHRVYAMSEKSHLGDGRVDAAQLLEESAKVAKRFIGFDMAHLAQESQSVISAVLFGALASSKTLPFTREQFEETIRRGGVGVEKSLLAFSKAFDISLSLEDQPQQLSDQDSIASFELPSTASLHPKIKSLIERIEQAFPKDCHEMMLHGVRRLVDYQDPDYAHLYLDRLHALKLSFTETEREGELIRESARHLALWMSYEDTARVAGLKIRSTRFDRVRQESQVQEGQMIQIHEYMHPRVQEVAETLPAPLGRMILGSVLLTRLLGIFTSKGRVIQTSSIRGFLLLSLVASAKKWRRTTLRFKAEQERIERWMTLIQAFAPQNSDKALEWIKCQSLVKGYSDTHERGVKNFERLFAFIKAKTQLDAQSIRSMREAALADEKGVALDLTIKKL